MASRGQCVVDILLETDGTPNKGWQTAPNIPRVVVENQDDPVGPYIYNPPDDGVIIVKKHYNFESEKLSPTYENRVWTFKVVIIASTDANLELMITQCREVFDRYTDSPWSTDTNSVTYDYARLIHGDTVEDINSWVFDGWIQLAQLVTSVVIA
jgi:hypothetical protein